MSGTESKRRGKAGLSTLRRQFTFVYGFAARSKILAPALVVLGLISSLIETVGIGLFVVLLYAAIIGRTHDAFGKGLLAHIANAVDAIAGGKPVLIAALIFSLIIAKAAVSVAYGALASKSKHAIVERARNAVYAKYLNLPYGWLQRRDRGELINALATETWSVADAYFSFMRMATNLCAAAVFGLVLLIISPAIFAAALLGSLLLSTIMFYASEPVRAKAQAAVDANKALTVHMVNSLGAMRTIRAFGVEDRVQQIYLAASARVADVFSRLDLAFIRIAPVSEVGQFALLGLVAWTAAIIGTPVPSALTAIALLYRLQPHLREFENHRVKLAGLDPSLTTVAKILEEPEPSASQSTNAPINLKREIRFDHVSLIYPGAAGPSLNDVSFTIPIGRMTAIIGPSGAGKTTILNLLCRLYEPSAGRILIDGETLSNVARTSWLATIAAAGQDIDLIEGTVRANIALARADATLPEIERASRLAGLHEFVSSLPAAYDTFVGERGLNLSGGQRQRVGLARAFLRNADILLLDEATNALDAPLEARVMASLIASRSGRTVVLITHEVAAAAKADHVIELAAGRVVAERTPAQLSIA